MIHTLVDFQGVYSPISHLDFAKSQIFIHVSPRHCAALAAAAPERSLRRPRDNGSERNFRHLSLGAETASLGRAKLSQASETAGKCVLSLGENVLTT